MSALGPEWVPDEQGIPHRNAARVILFDPRGRILLAIGHDRDEPERQWWFTIGGGLMEGESFQEGAVREMREETGIVLDPADLVGPVLYRDVLFDFLAVTARQEEWFFLARTTATTMDTSGWTDLERELIDGQKWWDLDELEREETRREVYPVGLAQRARRWREGWDGTIERVRER